MLSRTLFLLAFVAIGQQAMAQNLRALARVDISRSAAVDAGDGVRLKLALSQGVPFKITTLADPMRVAIDFREVAFDPSIVGLDKSSVVTGIQAGVIRAGWSRLVLEIAKPLGVSKAWMNTDSPAGSAELTIELDAVSTEVFAQSAVVPPQAGPVLASPKSRLMIALDPGHGGVDPGAQRNGQDEADLMLLFARELRETLLRSGRYDVVMTRTQDVFVSLPKRVSIARAAGADLFLSLHADALAEGYATGLTVYTLSEDTTDEASQALAERQNRADIVGGIDLQGDDDQIAKVLMDLARQDTAPQANKMADFLVETMREQLGQLHKRPRLEAGFSVLKAPDIPSVLLELGFMSSKTDLAALNDAEWREKAANGVLLSLDAWSKDADVAAEK